MRVLLLRQWWTALFVLVALAGIAVSSGSDAPPKESGSTLEEKTEAMEARKEAAKNALSLRVIELTSKNFGDSVGDGNVWLIEFYTPWCV